MYSLGLPHLGGEDVSPMQFRRWAQPDWQRGDAHIWGDLERQWASLLGPLSGAAFGFLLFLILIPLPDALTLAVALLLWADIALLSWVAFEANYCRQWREYHDALAANPVAWPWPTMPGEA
jgi:hypothetical protein